MRGFVPILLILGFMAPLPAATLTVDDDGPADYNNIQAAVKAAAKGDTIVLADGIYRGPGNRGISFESKPLIVTSRNGPERCIIDCEHKDRGFYLSGTYTVGAVIEGVTVLNGWAWWGAGICCDDRTSATIQNCVIRDNTASTEGGGVYCGNQASATVTDCVIYANTSENTGGGIRSNYANLTLTGCVVGHNRAASGGGLSSRGTPPQIVNTAFVQNTARTNGGGVQCEGSPQTLLHCVFLGNQAGQSGGGLWLSTYDTKTVAIVNCTLHGNTAGTSGGGLYCSSGASIQLINSILTSHTGHAIYSGWGSSPIIQGCLFHNNQPGDCYSSGASITGADRINALRTGNNNNRAGDPYFAVPGDIRLTLASRGVERGINEPGFELPATDIDGNPRIIDGNGGGMAVVDIGACEYNPQTPSIAVSTCFVEFVRESGGPEPESTALMIGHGGGGELNWEVDSNCPWLRVEPTSGIATDAPLQVMLATNTEGMPRGIYQTFLEIRDQNAINNPRRVLVTLRIQGTLSVPSQYPKIQDAINASMRNETIEVGPGTYQEALTLRKPVHLLGVGRPTLMVPATSYGILLEADGCTVDGFEILGGSIGISVGRSNNLIANNRILGSGTGISVGGTSTTLLSNEIASCTGRGLSVSGPGNTLKDNRMHDNPCNFSPSWRDSASLVNDIDTTNTVDGKAIYYLVGQSNVTIGANSNAGCVVAVNCRGIKLIDLEVSRNAYGILFVNTTDSQIADCVVLDNTEYGIYLSYSSRNKLTGNAITGCKHGLQIYGSADTVLRQNTMTDNLYNFHCTGSYPPEHWRQDITPDNTVNGKPICYLFGAKNKIIDASNNAGCVYAIQCSEITVRDLVLENNGTGVVFVQTEDSAIENVTALNNEYGGIVLNNSSNNVLLGNFVSNNTYGIAVTLGNYAVRGLQVMAAEKITIDRNIISGNKIGIQADSHALDVQNCHIAGNMDSGIQYGGTSLLGGTSLRVANCTLVGNGGSTSNNFYSGGISLGYASGVSIVNSVLWANTPKQIAFQQGTIQVTHCAIQGGYAGEGNLSSDPAVTPDGHLTPGSPCIGSGHRGDAAPYDLDGEPRDPNGPVDIGCDQFLDADHDGLPDWWELAYFGDKTIARAGDDPDADGHDNATEYELYASEPTVSAAIYYVDAGRPDDSNDGLSWDTAKKTIQAAINVAANSDGIRVAPGVYSEQVTTAGRMILLTGLDPEDSDAVAATVLAGTLTIDSGESQGCVIEGLTISNPAGTGLRCAGSSPTIRRCRITGNRCSDWQGGGGVTLMGAAPLITRCTISGNRTYSRGAGIYSWLSSPILRNCIVAGNTLASEGVALYADQSDVMIENCTIAHNGVTPAWGPPQGSAIQCLKSTMRIANSILWNDSPVQVLGTESSIAVTYCDIKGGAEPLKGISRARGNISVDPQFVSPGRWDSTSSYPWDSTAPWIEGDYHLKSAGWRWVPSMSHGTHWIWDDITSRCIDAGNPAAALGQEPVETPDDPEQQWGRNIRINMGAYGGTREASIAPRGWAILTDVNNDGRADLRDFAYWAEAFRSRDKLDPANATRGPRVDYADLSRLAADWLETTSWSH